MKISAFSALKSVFSAGVVVALLGATVSCTTVMPGYDNHRGYYPNGNHQGKGKHDNKKAQHKNNHDKNKHNYDKNKNKHYKNKKAQHKKNNGRYNNDGRYQNSNYRYK